MKTFDSLKEMAEALKPEYKPEPVQVQKEYSAEERQELDENWERCHWQMDTEETKLTPEQLKNWRKMAPLLFGISGAHMSDEDIQKFRDNMQKNLNKKDTK